MGSQTQASGDYALATGYKTVASETNSVAMGDKTKATGISSIAMGHSSEAKGYASFASGGDAIHKGGIALTAGSMALGTETIAGGEAGDEEAVAIGYRAEATGDKTIALGFDALADIDGGIALGSNAKTTVDKGVVGYYTITEAAKVFADGISDKDKAVWKSTNAALAIGDAEHNQTRQITGLAAGFNDTDAVNVAQLKLIKAAVDTAISKKNYFHVNSSDETVLGTTTNLDTVDGPGGARGVHSIAAGVEAQALTTDSIAIGSGAIAGDLPHPISPTDMTMTEVKQGSIAIGGRMEATGESSVAIGGAFGVGNNKSVASGDHSITIGSGNTSSHMNAITLGNTNKATADFTMAIGSNSQALKQNAIAIGRGADAEEQNTIVLGSSRANGEDAIAIGRATTANGEGAVAIGYDNYAKGNYSFATGTRTQAKGNYSFAGGAESLAFGDGSVAMGGKSYWAESFENKDIGARALSAGSIAIGEGTVAGTRIDDTPDNKYDVINFTQGREEAVAMGYRSKATADKSLSLGFDSKAIGEKSIALGVEATAGKATVGDNGQLNDFADGVYTDVSTEPAISIGYRTQATGDKTIALGFDTKADIAGGIALGSNAKTTSDKGKVGYDAETKKLSTQTNATWKATNAALAIGDVENNHTRQITGLAAGTDDTDAVNVAQLKSIKATADTAINKKNYFHVNSTGKVKTGKATNLDTVDGIGGAHGIASTALGMNAKAFEEDSIAFGTGATVSHEDQREKKYMGVVVRPYKAGDGKGGIAIGKGSWAHTMTAGQHEAVVAFNHKENTQNMVGGISIGENTHTRVGSIDIGNRDYRGKVGDIDFKGDSLNIIDAVGTTTIGTNSFNSGNFATISGAYNTITNRPTKVGGSGFFSNSARAVQGLGSTITGSFNSIENNFADGSPLSGLASNIVGMGNKINKSNGSLIMGTGNKITNSYVKVDNGLLMNPKDTIKEMQDTLLDFTDKERLASVGIFGGSNIVDYTALSNITGVGNKLTGSAPDDLDQASLQNLEGSSLKGLSLLNNIIGYENIATNVTSLSIQGTHNTVENAKETIVFGNNNNVLGVAEDSANNLDKNLAERNIILGFNSISETQEDDGTGGTKTVKIINGSVKNSAKDVFVLGNDVKANLDNSVYLGSKSTEAESTHSIGGGEYISSMDGYNVKFAGKTSNGIVSVGSSGHERRI